MPDNTVVAVKDNKDRDAIHDAMFLKHLEKTHSKDPAHPPPTHTICVLASDMEWRLNHHTYVPMSSYMVETLSMQRVAEILYGRIRVLSA